MGETLDVWDYNRSNPIHTFTWGADAINCVRYNPAETSLVATTASDRSIALYDIRESAAMKKIVMPMRSNKLAWNPMEPFNFVVANEDHNLYTYGKWRYHG